MSKALYPVLDGVTHKGKKMYTVLDGIARKVKKGYVGVAEKYRYLEYIESSGTQYIDTGFVPDNNTRVVMDAQIVSGTETAVLFGARTSATSNNYAFLRTSVADTFRSDYNNVYTQSWVVDSSARYVVDKNAETTTFAGTTQSYTNAAFQCPCNMTLFALNQAGTIQWNAIMKLYSCQIYDNGTLVRDYVPCIDPNGAVGLFDKVEKKFYANAGTGVFTAGAETGEVYTQSVARLFYNANPFVSYSGTYTMSEITDSAGTPYILYTLTGSGNLVLAGDVLYWMCGGGSRGNSSYSGSGTMQNTRAAGGGGAGAYVFSTNLDLGEYTVTIGSGNGGKSSITKSASTIGTAAGGGASTTSSVAGETQATGCNGGSGGGGAYVRRYYYESDNAYYDAQSGGTGAGVSTIPFGVVSLKKHCAGGTGGANFSPYYGGAGGSNGGGGGTGGSTLRGSADYGGGVGGTTSNNGGAATFYGSGGGGAGMNDSMLSNKAGGSGYQGVAYVLVPA